MDTIKPRAQNGSPRRFAFVLPRYHPGLAGGAETLAAALGHHLAARGDEVEILTTCARDNRTWANELEPGSEEESGVTIRRFPVDERDLDRWVPLQIKISEGMTLSLDEQFAWMEHSVNSRALYREIATRAEYFDALFFAPYLFGTTFWGSQVAPERSILIPCLHDEAYARLDIIGEMFRGVRGSLFNAHFERELALQLYGPLPGGEVGMGFDPHPAGYREGLSPYFSESFPYVLYLGRKETGKNAHLLVDNFIQLKASGVVPSLKLVVLGGGSFEDLHRPHALARDDVIDVPHVSEEEKHRLLRHATVLCQPSTNESFSIVLMEAWLLGTPVLVNAQCPVTRYHVVSSGGGLYFGRADEFSATVATLIGDPALRARLAQAGERYVRMKYSWSAVLDRFEGVMRDLGVRSETTIERGAQPREGSEA